jgi:hypothetical protein
MGMGKPFVVGLFNVAKNFFADEAGALRGGD